MTRPGRPKPLSLPQLAQFHAHLPLAKAIAISYWSGVSWAWRLVDFDDIESFAQAGLLDAVRRYDPARGRFPSYAALRIVGAIRDGMRGADWWSREARRRGFSRAAVRNLDDMPNWSNILEVEQAEPLLDQEDLLDYLAARLAGHYRTVLVLMRAGLNDRQIAEWLKISRSRALQLRRESLSQCRILIDQHAPVESRDQRR